MIEIFNNLKDSIDKEISDKLDKNLQNISTIDDEGLNQIMNRYGKKYVGDKRTKFIKYLKSWAAKEQKDKLTEIEEIEKAPDFTGTFIITVEWTKSRTWGSNPKAFTNYGFESSSIGGCGYDKLSTATGQALNSNKSILKLMYIKKDENINKSNHEVLGYGSGYGILPSFEGGVGVSSHQRIIEGIGLKWNYITSTKHTDVIVITKV